MTMIFRDGFFHGDPHPANILVIRPDLIGLVDFGLAGKLTDDDIVEGDAALHRRRERERRRPSEAARRPRRPLPEGARGRVPSPRSASFYYRYYGASLSEIDPLQVIREVFGVIYSLNLRLPTRFIILDKAIATLGVGRRRALPGLQRLRGREAVRAEPAARPLHAAARDLPGRGASRVKLASIFAEYPYQVHDVLEQMRDGQIEVGFVHKGLDEFMHKLDVAFNRLIIALRRRGRADRLEPDRRLRDRPARRCSG